MVSIDRRQFLTLGSIIGVSALAGCQRIQSGDTPITEDDPTLGLAVSASGPNCLHTSADATSAWIHTVAHGETYDVTFDARVSHSRGETAGVDLRSTPMAGEYVLEFTTDSADEKQPVSEADCEVGTRLIGGGSLQRDFETLRVAMNSRTLQTIEREGTMPRLHRLPNPIDA